MEPTPTSDFKERPDLPPLTRQVMLVEVYKFVPRVKCLNLGRRQVRELMPEGTPPDGKLPTYRGWQLLAVNADSHFSVGIKK